MQWIFEIPGRPVPKGRGRENWHTPDRTVCFEATVAAAAVKAGLRVGDGACKIEVLAWVPDLRDFDDDNLLKSVVDGVVKAGRMALRDDRWKNVRRKEVEVLGVDRLNPRVIVTVTLVDPAIKVVS